MFLLNRACCLFVTFHHEFRNREWNDRFVLPFEKELINLLFELLITQRKLENLSYLSSRLLSQRWWFRRIHSNVLRNIESDLAYTLVISQYILRSGSLWYPLSTSMFKDKQIFLLVVSKLMAAFSLWLQNLVQPIININ